MDTQQGNDSVGAFIGIVARFRRNRSAEAPANFDGV